MIRAVGLCLMMSGVFASIGFSQEKPAPTDAEKAAMADIRKVQDCAAQGRRNYATIEVPDRAR